MLRIGAAGVRVHFVGIGGAGMSGIAEVLLNLGCRVSGSDLASSDRSRRLARLGARVRCGHRTRNVTPEVDVVVISSAVGEENPEVVRARALNIPVIPRAEMLAELMRMKVGIAVAGTHGKTTTTSLVAAALGHAGLDPTVVIGGTVRGLRANGRLGKGELLVAEADESDGTFLLLSPTIAVVTNIDPEHLDYYGDMDRVRSAYLEFIHRVPFYGRAILCLDNATVRALVPQVRKRLVTFGSTPEADYVAVDLRVRECETRFTVLRGGVHLGELRLPLPGRHYALNALAALAAASEVGVPFATVARALSRFSGIRRRFEVRGTAAGVTVVDDYAHHPAEIRATLRAAREGFNRRLVIVFQPHRFTRTRDLFEEFVGSFDDADLLVLTEVYPAGEAPIPGVTGRALSEALRARGRLDVRFLPERAEIAAAVAPDLRQGDLVMTLGAGNVHEVGPALLAELRGTPAYRRAE